VPRAETPQPPADAQVGPNGPLPAGSAPEQGSETDSTPPLTTPAQILDGSIV